MEAGGDRGGVSREAAGTGGGVEDRGMSHRCRQVIGRQSAGTEASI